MRLIDADAFADDLLGYIFERGQASGKWDEQLERDMITYADIEYANGYDYALEEFHRNLIERPTVEAIPIEWLHSIMERQLIFALNSEMEGTTTVKDGVIHCVSGALACQVLANVIELWEKENEIDRCG